MVGSNVAVGNIVLVGNGVGVSGTPPVTGVFDAKGVRTDGKVGGAIGSPSRGAVDNKNIPPQ